MKYLLLLLTLSSCSNHFGTTSSLPNPGLQRGPASSSPGAQDEAIGGCMMGIMETLNAHSPGKRPPDFALTVRRECDRMVPRIDTIADHDEAEAFSKSPFYYGCGLGAAATLVSLKKPINSLERYCPSGLK